jgi:uncharacterized membrane protein YphA (DoxX/SURF4 family)
VRRLFSTFAHGAPGAGLLLMRIAAGSALVVHGVAGLAAGSAAPSVALDILSAVMGVLLLVGLWTPIVAVLATIDAALLAFSDPANQRFYILLAVLAAALALLGPGAFSVDARLFGWRRVEIRNGNGNGNNNQKRRDPPPI